MKENYGQKLNRVTNNLLTQMATNYVHTNDRNGREVNLEPLHASNHTQYRRQDGSYLIDKSDPMDTATFAYNQMVESDRRAIARHYNMPLSAVSKNESQTYRNTNPETLLSMTQRNANCVASRDHEMYE